ncbi:MAG: MGMT family protein [Mariniblastus sp.]
MKLKEVVSELKAAGSAQTRKTYGRHGVTRTMYGVSYAVLGKLTKKIKTDHELALGLWETGNHDAMVLATMVAEPGKLKPADANQWLKEIDSYVLLDGFCKLISQTTFAMKRADVWMKSKNEWKSTSGWGVLAQVAGSGLLSRERLAIYLDTIEQTIHDAPNRTRYTMNGCLIAIGMASEELKDIAIQAARRIGVVEVDHGDTSCKTPDAASYIAKSFARSKKKASKQKVSKKIVAKKAAAIGKSKTKATVSSSNLGKSAGSAQVKKSRARVGLNSRAKTPSENTQAIIAMIRNIPKGQVASYGQIARLAGVPRNSRQVGAILKSLPPNQGIPWFRVVNSKGEISPRKSPDCHTRQRDMLESEGVVFTDRGKVSLNEYGWEA